MNRKHEWCRRRRKIARSVVEVSGFLGLCGLVSLSAILTKHATHQRQLMPLAQVSEVAHAPAESGGSDVRVAAVVAPASEQMGTGVLDTGLMADRDLGIGGVLGMTITDPLIEAEHLGDVPAAGHTQYPPETRWFNGRPVRPVRTMRMTVTAYSPDARSCGDSADGITASLHSVWTNGMKFAAADTRLLPIGSMISVPGYDNEQIVPVLDRGGAIKGHRLDMLYPTHEIAQQWGVRRLQVTVWEYADGKPKTDWRKVRDSK